MDLIKLTAENKKAVIVLTLLAPVLLIIITLARFGTGFNLSLDVLLGLLSFAVGGFVSAIILLYYLENSSTKKARAIVIAGYVLTYPLMLLIGLVYGLLVGHFAPTIGAVLQGLVLGVFYLVGRLMPKEKA